MEYLEHHGILGQKWGVRRYQNPDGTLTEVGKKHYSESSKKFSKLERDFNRKSYRLHRRQEKAQKVLARPTLSDISWTAKRRQGTKLSKAYRSYIKSGKKFMKNYEGMKKKYGINNLSSYQIEKGKAYVEQYLKAKGTI